MKKDITLPSTAIVSLGESVQIEIVELDDLDLADVAGGTTPVGGNSSICSCTVNLYCPPKAL